MSGCKAMAIVEVVIMQDLHAIIVYSPDLLFIASHAKRIFLA
jgi:hypothetical protein